MIRDGPLRGPDNMARDHALALATAPGEGVLRIYGWAPPALSFGRNEPARGHYDPDAAAGLGLDVVRRPTGGRAVLHRGEVTYAVVLGARELGGPRAVYRLVGACLVRGLRLLGVPAEVSERGSVTGPAGGPCFREAAPGEVTVGGRKLVGSAQARIGGAILQHGSVLLEDDQSALLRIAPGLGSLHCAATLRQVLRRVPPADEVADALAEGFRLALGGAWQEAGYRPGECERATALAKERYATWEWTWRR